MDRQDAELIVGDDWHHFGGYSIDDCVICCYCGVATDRGDPNPDNVDHSTGCDYVEAKELLSIRQYTQGVCEDGAAILKDGVLMTIEEILTELNS